MAASLPVEISLLIPFDVGRSYVFRATPLRCAKCVWRKIFQSSVAERAAGETWEWRTGELGRERPYFREPFGPLVRLVLKQPGVAAWEGQAEFHQWLNPVESVEAVCFPRGIGVVAIRGTWLANQSSSSWLDAFWDRRESLKASLTPLLQALQKKYKHVMDDAVRTLPADAGAIYPIDLPERRKTLEQARFPYPIAVRAGDPRGNGTKDSEEPFGYPIESPYLRIRVGSNDSFAYSSKDSKEARAILENIFIVAIASWFSLVVMNSIVSEFMQSSFASMSSELTKKRKKQLGFNSRSGNLLRLSFIDAANSSRPACWSFRRDDILLLDHIHELWTTKRWWKIVEERTALLAAHHSEEASERRRESERKITIIALILAVVTSITGSKDAVEAYCKGEYSVFIFAALIFLVLVLYFRRSAPPGDVSSGELS